MILRIFEFASWSLLKPILDRFWFDFGSPNRSKIDPKSAPNHLKPHARFWTPSRTTKNQVFDQHDPNLAPKWAPQRYVFGGFWEPEMDLEHPKAPTTASFQFWTDLGPILDQIWTDLGTILNGFWIDFWMMFQVFVACHMLFVVCCQLFVACGLLLVVCCLFGVLCSFAICSWLFFIVCCLPCAV